MKKKIIKSSTIIGKNGSEDNKYSDSRLFFEREARTFLGFDSCKSNVLAERDDCAAKSFCYDAE